MGHPNLVGLDEIPERAIDNGDLRGRRTRVGAAAGALRAGLSRYRLGPGERAIPVHVHADEEELFYVVRGSGLSWQDGRTYRVGEGDLLVHHPRGAPHTIVGGDDGLEVLAFGSGSDTGMTWLPRARAWWMGPHWLPDDAPNPFTREAAAGPLELPAPAPERPPHSAALVDTPIKRTERPGFRETYRRLADVAGSVTCGLNHCALEPGQQSAPLHWHTLEEECFVVLAGEGEALLDAARLPLRPGSVLWRPPHTGVAHALRAGASGLTYLAIGTRRHGDVVFYPRSGKLNFGRGLVFRVQRTDYWDGEE